MIFSPARGPASRTRRTVLPPRNGPRLPGSPLGGVHRSTGGSPDSNGVREQLATHAREMLSPHVTRNARDTTRKRTVSAQSITHSVERKRELAALEKRQQALACFDGYLSEEIACDTVGEEAACDTGGALR